jgi:hypothetical protein
VKRSEQLNKRLNAAKRLAKTTRERYIRSERVLSEMEQRASREAQRATQPSELAERMPAINPANRNA